MQGLGILILIVLFFWVCWPAISKWLKRKAMERMENYMRQAMGMPPRPKKKKNSRSSSHPETEFNESGAAHNDSFYYRSRRNSSQSHPRSQSIIPKEYAEDVEFVEIKEFSSHSHSKATGETYNESQISDAEWTEIKISKKS